MRYLLFEIGFYFVPMLAVSVPCTMLLCQKYRQKGIAYGKGFPFGVQLLVLLLCAMLCVTEAAGIDNVLRVGVSLIRPEEINLAPLTDGGGPTGMALNALLFVPLGALLPLLFGSCRLCRTTAIGFSLSLFIELSQLFNYRATDIDDLLMNTLGTILGYLIYTLLLRRLSWFRADNIGIAAPAAASCVSAAAAVYMLVCSPLLSALWWLLLL